jgi:lipoprotein NlpI
MQYNNLISKYPDYCIAYFNRGLALYYSGQYEKAKLDFQKSFELGFLESKIWMEKIK